MDKEQVKEEKVLEKKERKKLLNSFPKQLIFCVSILAVIFLIDKICINAVEEYKFKEEVNERKEIIGSEMLYEIETIECGKEVISISGWAAWDEENWESTAVVWQATDLSDSIVVKAEQGERQDVNNYFTSNGNVKNTGFLAELKSNKLKENICYEMFVDVSYKTTSERGLVIRPGVKITTNKYFYNGACYDYNPLEFVEPDVDDAEWQMTIKNGKLCDYSMEHGTWIYLYEDTLYWILKADKMPAFDKLPSVLIRAYTDRDDLVPEELQEKFITRGYVSTEIYLTEEHYLDNGDFFGVSYELPAEYPVVYVQTGPYGNRDGIGLMFQGFFRLHTLEEMKQWD